MVSGDVDVNNVPTVSVDSGLLASLANPDSTFTESVTFPYPSSGAAQDRPKVLKEVPQLVSRQFSVIFYLNI